MDQELRKNIEQFLASAELVYLHKDYTSAAILYFKTLFVTLDLAILRKRKITPKDHTQRFQILKIDFPEEYNLLDRYFEVYRSTYSTTIDKETCEEIRIYVTKTVKKYT